MNINYSKLLTTWGFVAVFLFLHIPQAHAFELFPSVLDIAHEEAQKSNNYTYPFSPLLEVDVTPVPTIIPKKNTSLIPKAQAQESGFCLTVPVLLYHHIKPYEKAKVAGHAQLTVDASYFDQHMKYLSEHGYKTIAAEELVVALINKQQLPEKSVVVTLDDGYDDNYTYAFPIAKTYNTILNLMVPSGLVGNPGYVNWGNLSEMTSSGLVKIYNHTWSHRSMLYSDTATNEKELETSKAQLKEMLGVTSPVFTYPYGEYDGRSIESLKKLGFVGAFTTVHSRIQCDSFLFTLHREHIGNSPLSSYGL